MRRKSGPKDAWKAGWMPAGVGANYGARKTAAFRVLPTRQTSLSISETGHPFSEPTIAADLDRRESEIESAFARLAAVLEDLAPQQFSEGFAQTAVSTLSGIGVNADPEWFDADWTRPLDMGAIHARCASRLFARMVETGSEGVRFACSDGEPVEDLIRRWGFHAVDITPCADGRLAGLLGAVLRVPLSIVSARRSYAGAMFGVVDAVRDWEQVELKRWRTATPNAADENTRYLKMGVYHFSSIDPSHEGCAAHGSDDNKAVGSLLDRLIEFKGAIEARHDAGEGIALLMVGVDTDTDAIRVHVPDAAGKICPSRFVCANDLHEATNNMAREDAKMAVRQAVADCAGVATNDEATEGMRWLCGYLLKNNLAQVEAVLRKYQGPYPEAGHAEKLIVIGDPVDDVQLRNLAFQAQMGSVEEGADDLAVGVKILGKSSAESGLSVPVLVLRHYDSAIPGDREAAATAANRMRGAVEAHTAGKSVVVEAAVRPQTGGSLEFLTTAMRGDTGSCMS